MGYLTLVEMWIFVCIPAWGPWAAYVGWGLWILGSTAAVAVTLSLGVLLMSEAHQHSLGTITAAQLLPIAATIVAAGTGSDMAAALPNPQHALATAIASYILWGMAVPMAFSVLVIYYQRLALHKMPPREVIVSAFLPLGPLGLGGRAILNLGLVCKDVFPSTGSVDPIAGQIAYVVGFFVALIMWSWGLVWFAFAVASIYRSRPIPFVSEHRTLGYGHLDLYTGSGEILSFGFARYLSCSLSNVTAIKSYGIFPLTSSRTWVGGGSPSRLGSTVPVQCSSESSCHPFS